MADAIPYIRVQDTPLDAAALAARLTDPRAGALVVFEGRARDHHEGRPVLKLSYEAYAPMAEKELERLRQQAFERFGLLGCAVHHRVGEVPLTEAAVVVATASVHRAEAFQAAAWVMDEIKARVPIWKRETYRDGSEAWVECQHRHTAL
ncbi:MAG TPA: molybdenum cofactor biosynthesis protein MoaE [Holophagaceae bacterium]|nr:molybdenum cofactor biosynthesis protein MoaE [Holophagaceae bacterium]